MGKIVNLGVKLTLCTCTPSGYCAFILFCVRLWVELLGNLEGNFPSEGPEINTVHVQPLCSTITSTRGIQQQASFAWRLGKLNHVAIAVPDLEEATKLYRDVFGATVSDVTV